MLLRNIGKVLRGKVTPFQIVAATVLGSMIGFVPGFMNGPGLFIALLLLLLVFNANLFVAAAVGGIAKLLSLVLLPISFAMGRVLLDGPTQPVFKSAINTPVLALFGFEHYATTGGVFLGLIFGLVTGLLIVSVVGSFRRRMATLEEGSEAFRKYAGKGWVKLLQWLLLGGMAGKSYAELAKTGRVGNPIRVIGVVCAVLIVGLLVVLQMFFSEPIVTAALKSGLERANGATVDMQKADLNLKDGRLVITGLAMADPNALDTDLLRAQTVEAQINTKDLLTKRIAMDRVVISEASQGEKRSIPGRLVGKKPEPPDDPSDMKSLEDYIKEAKVWKERLSQARKWLEEMSGEEAQPTGPDGQPLPQSETLRERLAREAALLGYARVRATHLIEGAPSFLVRELVVDGVKTTYVENDPLDIRGENLSTNPSLVPGEPRFTVKSRSGRLDADVRFGAPAAGKVGGIAFLYKGLSTDAIASQLIPTNPPPIAGGTTDLSINGAWSAQGVGFVDLPLNVTLRDATVSVAGAGSAKVSEMTVPLGIKGPMDNPGIVIDQNQLADALAKAGADELSKRARGEAQKLLDKETDKLGDKAKGVLDNFLGGKKK